MYAKWVVAVAFLIMVPGTLGSYFRFPDFSVAVSLRARTMYHSVSLRSAQRSSTSAGCWMGKQAQRTVEIAWFRWSLPGHRGENEAEWFAQGQSQNEPGTLDFFPRLAPPLKGQQLGRGGKTAPLRLGRAGFSVLHSTHLYPLLNMKVFHSSFWSIIHFPCSWVDPLKKNKKCMWNWIELNWVSLGLGSPISKIGVTIHLSACSLNECL